MSIDNTVHGGYATRPYTAIWPGTGTAAGITDISKHLQEGNGYSSTSVCSRQNNISCGRFVRTNVFYGTKVSMLVFTCIVYGALAYNVVRLTNNLTQNTVTGD